MQNISVGGTVLIANTSSNVRMEKFPLKLNFKANTNNRKRRGKIPRLTSILEKHILTTQVCNFHFLQDTKFHHLQSLYWIVFQNMEK